MRKYTTLTPLARWLKDYVHENELTLSELGRMAGLSVGALRSLVVYPDRVPSLETCLRLATVTGKPAEEILLMAGIDAPDQVDHLNPERIELMRVYDRLPAPMRRVLVDVARAFQQAGQE